MDDGSEVIEGELHEGIGHGAGDEICVGGAATDDDAEGDDAVGLVFEEGRFDGDRDFKSAWDADEIDFCVG